jgi:cobalt/nickel transport system permease protein
VAFDTEFFNLGHMDALSYRDSFVHRLDPRIKLIVTLAFIVTVVSFSKYAVSAMAPFFLFPAVLFLAGDIPVPFILKKVLIVSPFAVCVGIFNPLLDRSITSDIWGMQITGGWVSFAGLMIKFALTVSAALLLISTTSFPEVCRAMQRLGLPALFTAQLLFLYRYIFVMMEETMRVVRARDTRSFGSRGQGMSVLASIAGVLFIRTVERSERVYQAMLSRGFDGTLRSPRTYRLTVADLAFSIAALAAFAVMRKYNIAVMLGDIFVGRLGGS